MSTILMFIRRRLATSRTITGAVLVAVSIVGVVGIVRLSTPGERVIMAADFLPAGTVITDDLIEDAKVSGNISSSDWPLADVIGRVVGFDIGKGEVITARLLEPTQSSRVQISVPLGVSPPTSLVNGSSVDLWSVDTEDEMPPVAVAQHAMVVAMTDSGFGGDAVITVLVDSLEVDRVLAVLGTRHVVVATSSENP